MGKGIYSGGGHTDQVLAHRQFVEISRVKEKVCIRLMDLKKAYDKVN